ncbi:MAG: hypothetical protein HFE39_10555 [Clostridiales bacterium]|jgi:hypothetical protein|nr:hypothetical protein [Clostridiales bacterium]
MEAFKEGQTNGRETGSAAVSKSQNASGFPVVRNSEAFLSSKIKIMPFWMHYENDTSALRGVMF